MDMDRKILIIALGKTACLDYTKEMLNQLRKYDFDFICNHKTKEFFHHEGLALNTYHNHFSFITRTPRFFLKIKTLLKNYKKKHPSFFIYFTAFHPWNLCIAYLAKKENIPVITTVHDYETHLGERSKSVEWFQKKTIKYANKIIFLSDHEKEKAIKDGFKLDKLLTLRHPLLYSSLNNSMSYNKPIKFLFLGRIKRYKGLDLLLKAIKGIQNLHLTIAGSGQLNYIKSANLTIINKHISQQKINALIESHHILILPYLDASQSGILTLGLSAQMVMLVSKVGGLVEQINEDAAIWFEPNIESLKNVINKIITNEELYNNKKIKVKIAKKNFEEEWQNKFSTIFKELLLIST